MGDFLTAIKDTPIPTILILVGLFIIVLAFVVKIGGVIEVSSEQRRWAIPVGLFVLIIGLVLNLSPVGKTPASEIPPGRYTNSCSSIEVKSDTLFAVCKRRDSSYNPTQLSRFEDCKTTIDNIDGVLECQK
ncbi:MAG: hypothetical protein KME09_19755 [Pleurocapsa minor HA4230-MV1]|jgi:hypothetical protein|nr:hypothetical protein [Pleurocapsa minor HA4230-MV1]